MTEINNEEEHIVTSDSVASDSVNNDGADNDGIVSEDEVKTGSGEKAAEDILDAAAQEAVKEDAGEEDREEDAADGDDMKAGNVGNVGNDRKDKKEKTDKQDLLIEELTDKYKRTFAEFDNFRKRTEKEKSAMYEIGARDVIEKILPIADNFERGLSTVPKEDRSLPFAEGMDKIYKQLVKTLEDMDVKPIEAVGMEFNPDFHNAVMHVEDESLGENIVAEEFQKGYTYRGTVIRHSMVKVAN